MIQVFGAGASGSFGRIVRTNTVKKLCYLPKNNAQKIGSLQISSQNWLHQSKIAGYETEVSNLTRILTFTKRDRFLGGEPLNMANVEEILAQNTTEKHYVEYMSFRSNHMAHGIIALHRLGATPDRIERFVDWYQKRLIPRNQCGETDSSEENIDDLLGKRKSYYAILDYYSKLLEETGDLDKLISQELYKMRHGIACSALHGLIQMGYGFSARHSRSVVEGIAYLHHSYSPLTVSDEEWNKPFGPGDMNMLEIADRLRRDDDLKQFMLDESASEFWNNRHVGMFQSKVGALLTKAGDKLMSYIHLLRYDSPISSMTDVLNLGRWLVDVTLTVYVTSEVRNDFFLLHGVTGAWSLLQLLSCFSNHQEGMELIKVYLSILLAVYVARGSPPLTIENKQQNLDDTDFWKDTIKEAIKEDRDEHIYKLVQVAYDLFKDASNDHQRSLYMNAAETALKYDLFL